MSLWYGNGAILMGIKEPGLRGILGKVPWKVGEKETFLSLRGAREWFR